MTRRTVLAEVELLGYERPSPARFRSGLVGLIVPELDNPVFPLFVQHTESALAAEGYTPLLCTATPIVQEGEYIDILLDRGVGGLIFISGRHTNTEVDHSRYGELRAAGIPIVLVNGYIDGLDAPFVSSDDVESTRTAVRHLRSLGHRRIGCAMGPARYITSQRKVEGFRRGLAELADGSAAATPDNGDLVVHSVYTVEGGQAATQMLLDEGVSAVVCGNDLMALGAVRAARARGLDVPRDFSVVGYDDSPLVTFTDPPLTTMRQDVYGISRHAVGALLDEVNGAPQPRRELLFQTQLLVRRSTGPADPGTASPTV